MTTKLLTTVFLIHSYVTKNLIYRLLPVATRIKPVCGSEKEKVMQKREIQKSRHNPIPQE